jgi:oxygen-independent coproporphyrinogen III oxidase
MAGIYIHIPFCRKACNYCNFHFSTSLENMQRVVDAMVQELTLRKVELTEPIETLYFGGGTPSLLLPKQLQQIMQAVTQHYLLLPTAEITLEANPDDVHTFILQEWKRIGINRLSMGVQSFVEEDLLWMSRAHNCIQAKQSILLAQQNGFTNLSVDLIYGMPTLTEEAWQQNVQVLIDLQVPHISCYALTVEDKTVLQHLIAKKKLLPMSEEKQQQHFMLLMQWMEAAGYQHYEISNFALPGKRSKHNSSYWQGKSYLGIGPAAHSFNGAKRSWNVANNSLYIAAIEQNKLPQESETLTPTQQLNEYIMTSLRTLEGIDLALVNTHFGASAATRLETTAQQSIQQNNLQKINNHLVLNAHARFLADGIAANLFQ